MADGELFDQFEDRELETLDIFLTSSASKTAITIDEFIQAMLSQGASRESIKQLLLTDLKQGGRIFNEFRNYIKSTARGSLNRLRDSAFYSEFGIDREYRWVAVLVKTCPDCLENHGKTMAWDEWQTSRFGMPRSGGTVCRQNCRCVLLIAEATQLEPLSRRQRQVATERGRL